MKLAVTYDNGQIFQHFGHCAQFKLYEIEDGKIVDAKVIDANGSGHGALAGMLMMQGVDALVCGEMKYHEMLDYLANGMAVVTCGHRESEAPALSALANYLQTNENLLQYNIRYFISGSVYVLCSKGGKAI